MPKALRGSRVPGSKRERLGEGVRLEVRVERSERNPRASTPNATVPDSVGWGCDRESRTWCLAWGGLVVAR